MTKRGYSGCAGLVLGHALTHCRTPRNSGMSGVARSGQALPYHQPLPAPQRLRPPHYMVQLLSLVVEWRTQEWRLLAAAATRAARLCAVPRGRWREHGQASRWSSLTD